MGMSLGPATVGRVMPETSAAIARLEASGLIAEALAAFRVDHVYAVTMANEHARMTRTAETAEARRANGPRLRVAAEGERPSKLSAADVQRAHELHREGQSVPDIAAAFGVSAAAVYKRLRGLRADQASAEARPA